MPGYNRRSVRAAIAAALTLAAALAVASLVLTARAGPPTAAGTALGRGSTLLVRADPRLSDAHTAPPRGFEQRPEQAVIAVTYQGSWPVQAKTAFQYAVDIWETQVASSITIDVTAVWTSTLPPGTLGAAGPTQYYRDFSGAPQPGTWYPVALANALNGSDLYAGNEIDASFSSNVSNWYFGTDGSPGAGDYDFASVALHELGHGLGFGGSMRYGSVCGGASAGCWGWGSGYPAIYDRFTEDGSGTALLAMPNNSNTLGAALTGGSLYFDGTNANGGNGGLRVPLYAPSTWDQGSSYAHLAESYNGSANALMTYSLALGESQHGPGPVMLGMFQDMGWSPQAPTATPSRTPTATASRTPTPSPTATATATQAPSATPTLITMTPATPNFIPLVMIGPSPLPSATPVPTPKWVNITTMNFENDFPGAWSLADNTGGQYQFGKSACRSFSGFYGGWAVGGGSLGSSLNCGDNYPDSTNSWMIYGPFSLANISVAELTLKAWYMTELNADHVRWLASPDGATYYGWQASGDSAGWVDLTLDLAAVPGYGDLTGDSSVWVALQFDSDVGTNLPEGLFVDNVKVRKCTQNCSGLALLLPAPGWQPALVLRP